MGSHEVYVVLSRSPGDAVKLAPGGLVGRLRGAELRIDDPRVSEAHAYVSLRDGALRLLALRGGLAVNGRLVREVNLAAGLRVTLAKGDPPIELTVEAVQHPATMLALRGPGLDDEMLAGRCLSLARDPGAGDSGERTLVLRDGWSPDALAVLFTDGAGWVGRVVGAAPVPLCVGSVLTVGDDAVEVVEIALQKGASATTDLEGAINRPVHIEGFFDTVHLHQVGQPPLVLTGTPARLIYELGTIGQPVWWRDVACTLWPDDVDDARLRKRWDVMMVRLRRRLAESAIRPSLVQSDGGGKVRLLLERADVFRDCG